MALKLYDTLNPSGDFPLVEAKDVKMPDGSRLSEFNPSVGEDVKADIDALKAQDQEFAEIAQEAIERMNSLDSRVGTVEESTETALGGMLAVSLRVTALERVATSVDLTNYESNGVIAETYSDGSTKTYTMEFDENGNPVKIAEVTKNGDGEVVKETETTLAW